ncbi:MAG: sugar transferase, partial [Bacteroidota bacterium]
MERYTQNRAHLLQKYIVVALEVLLLIYGFRLGLWLLGDSASQVWASTDNGPLLLVLMVFAWLGVGSNINHYHYEAILQIKYLLKTTLINLAICSVVLLVLNYYYPEVFPSLALMFYTGVFAATGVRLLLGYAYRHRRSFFSLVGEDYKVMIVGVGETAQELNKFFSQAKGSQVYNFLGNIKNEDEAVQMIRERKEELKDFCLNEGVSEIYYSLPLSSSDVIEEMADFADNNYIHFKIAHDFDLLSKHKDISVAFFNHTPIISLRRDPLASWFNRVLKRSFDLFFATMVCLFVMPFVFLIIGTAIRLNSKGPILFLQKRSGRKNRNFTCFKFRTMYVQKEGADTPYKQATKNDPRITKVGAFLRKTNLDEFPQFINVLLGHMSVVGPRPHPPKLNDQYIPLIKKYPFRYFITPGITGHAQVNGF